MALGVRISSCRCRVSAAGRGGKKPGRRTQRGPSALCDTAVAGADVRGWCVSTHAHRASCIACHDMKPTTHTGGGPGKAGGGEQMSRRERPTDAQRTPPQLVEKPKDKTAPGPGPGPGPKQRARARSGARRGRIEQRTPYTRIRPVSPPEGYCVVSYPCARPNAGWNAGWRVGRDAPTPSSCLRLPWLPLPLPTSLLSPILLTPPPRDSAISTCPPSPLAPAGVRRSARGSWGVGSRPSWVSVRQSEAQSGVWARSLLPPTLLLHARLSLEAAEGEDALVGGGVGLDADAKDVLEANSDAEVGPSKEHHHKRGPGGVMQPRQTGLTMWACGAEGRKATSPAEGVRLRHRHRAAVADLDARRSGEGERGEQGEVWACMRARRCDPEAKSLLLLHDAVNDADDDGADGCNDSKNDRVREIDGGGAGSARDDRTGGTIAM
ncbi:hypothetical protein B0H14DRAFT_2621639 [Mycena olivaceomarginata]|nr:hypothetical protein B0H14DRAFT_2621639 [Mycena olivaceomarginata]